MYLNSPNQNSGDGPGNVGQMRNIRETLNGDMSNILTTSSLSFNKTQPNKVDLCPCSPKSQILFSILLADRAIVINNNKLARM